MKLGNTLRYKINMKEHLLYDAFAGQLELYSDVHKYITFQLYNPLNHLLRVEIELPVKHEIFKSNI